MRHHHEEESAWLDNLEAQPRVFPRLDDFPLVRTSSTFRTTVRTGGQGSTHTRNGVGSGIGDAGAGEFGDGTDGTRGGTRDGAGDRGRIGDADAGGFGDDGEGRYGTRGGGDAVPRRQVDAPAGDD